MSSPIMRSSFQSDLLPIINGWHGDDLKMQDDLVSKICEVESSSQAFEVAGVLSGMSTLQQVGEGEAFNYDTSRQMYTPRFTHDKWGSGFKITLEMMQDGRAMKEARRFTKMLTKAVAETKNIIAANLLNNAYTSGKVQDGGDGVILCSASHPALNGNLSNTISSNADLSEAAIETLYIQIRNAKDDRGLRINLKPRKIVVNVGQEPDLNRILTSTLRVGTADNDPNFIRNSSMFPEGHVASPYITDTDAFYILTDCMDGLKFYNRYESEIEKDNEFDTKNAAFSKLIRVSSGWINYRGVFASPGV
jgi:hypothetical protein